MKMLLLLLFGGLCSLGGYWLGQQPDSPDVIGWLSTGATAVGGQVDQAVDAGRKQFAPLFAGPEAAEEKAVPANLSAEQDRPRGEAAEPVRKDPPVPPCW